MEDHSANSMDQYQVEEGTIYVPPFTTTEAAEETAVYDATAYEWADLFLAQTEELLRQTDELLLMTAAFRVTLEI